MSYIEHLIENKENKLTEINKNYGEIARSNGDKFEIEICEYYNKYENNKKIVNIIREIYPDISLDGKFIKCDSKLVKSIHRKKTKRKTDIWYQTEEKKIGFSVKMTNKGTQLQIISLSIFIIYLNSRGIKMNEKTKVGFEKFLGLIKPTKDELKIFNESRTKKNKNKQRYLMYELEQETQNRICMFLKTHYSIIIELILKTGLCMEEEDKANLFIFNNVSYTNTGKIQPYIYNYSELKEKYKEDVKITKLGSLELNKYIGLQMKGSGKKGSSAYHSLQFKLRK